MPKLTLKRESANAPIFIKLMVFNPSMETGAETTGIFDTGNDHTVISGALFSSLGLSTSGRRLPVRGVTGSAMADTAWVTLGLEFDGGHRVTITDHEVVVVNGASDPVLIGRDFLERFDVAIRRDGEFTLEC